MTKTPETDQKSLIGHAVAVGLTPLIPVPFLDDTVKNYLLRRMVRSIARNQGRDLDQKDVDALADDSAGFGCLGCVGSVLIYPFTRLARKIFLFLEWKRAVDTASITLHRGYLVDQALRRGWMQPDGKSAAPVVRSAIDAVIRDAPIKPVEEAVRQTFRQSRNVLKGAVDLMRRALTGLPPKAKPSEVGEAIEPVAEQETQQIDGVVSALKDKLALIPPDHFEKLVKRLGAMLGEDV